jgi:hypothetical protein
MVITSSIWENIWYIDFDLKILREWLIRDYENEIANQKKVYD